MSRADELYKQTCRKILETRNGTTQTRSRTPQSLPTRPRRPMNISITIFILCMLLPEIVYKVSDKTGNDPKEEPKANNTNYLTYHYYHPSFLIF